MSVDKTLGAKEAGILAIGDQEKDGIPLGSLFLQDTGHLEDLGHAGAVVGDAWRGGYRIIVGGQHQGRAGFLAGQPGGDVVHLGAGSVRPGT